MDKPEEGKVLILGMRIGQSHYGCIKGADYFKFRPIRSSVCKCITHYELDLIDSSDISDWKYPENQRELNTIFEDYL